MLWAYTTNLSVNMLGKWLEQKIKTQKGGMYRGFWLKLTGYVWKCYLGEYFYLF